MVFTLRNFFIKADWALGLLILISFFIISCDGKGGRYGLIVDPNKSDNQNVKLDPQAPFGLSLDLSNVKVDELINVRIRYSGPGKVVIVAQHNDANYYYRKMESKVVAGENWLDLSLEVVIPQLMKGEDLKIYVWNPGQEEVLIDDFSVDYRKEQSFPDFDPMEGLHIYIDSLDMLALHRKREEAFDEGILVTADDDYVNGILFYKDSILPVEMRLKGDWLDHLEGKKWSFRIKVKGDFTWNRVKTFSIHNPLARDFINEWLAHELYTEAGSLAPRYGFVPVTLNGKSLGVYAWEEHFDKHLIENLNRREGPIVKFSEDHFWTVQKILAKENFGLAYPFLEAANISPFKESRTLGDSVLKAQFELASDLMYQYQYGLTQLKDIFDLDKFASYHALMDVTRGFHGLAWHNQRFYYNPVLNKLEPIFFDGYTELGTIGDERAPITGWFNIDDKQKSFEELLLLRIYQDKDFRRLLLEKYEEYTSSQWINDFMISRMESINDYEEMIQAEYSDYNFDKDFLLNNARAIRSTLKSYREYIDNNPDFAMFNNTTVNNRPYAKDYHPDVLEAYVRAFQLDSINSESRIVVRNYIPRPIWIIGYGDNPRRKMRDLEEPIKLEALTKFYPDVDTLFTTGESSWLFCADDSANQIFPVEVKPYRSPINKSPSMDLMNSFSMNLPEGVYHNDNSIVFHKAFYRVSSPIIIPDGYNVEFEKGCHLDFVNNAMFISYSSIQMNGSASDPIVIKSSDNTANGFSVIQASDTCRIRNVNFEGLNTLNYNGWTLTGAVNFYESPVLIDSSSFIENNCEDALNIIRSYFELKNSNFQNIFADAFDSDFCSGLVKNVRFQYIGNDAIDFSGSRVEIIDCEILDVGDKGVSCGEGSELSVVNTIVDGANIGFASKDLSSLLLTGCTGRNLNYGLVAFQKKPEYGPAYITARKFKGQSINTIHLIEQASVLKLNSSLVNGQEKSVALRFY